MQREKRNDRFRPKTKWISTGIEELFTNNTEEFDVIIIGSGYGGSIAASQLSGCVSEDGKPIKICVLERGREYLSGMFPTNVSELPKHVRYNTQNRTTPQGNLEGLFDIRICNDVSTILANGLGGGSLINAGVMEIPNEQVFNKSDWPKNINYSDLLPYYKKSKKLLGAATKSNKSKYSDNTITEHIPTADHPEKYKALKKLAKDCNFRDAAITVALKDKENYSSDFYQEVELKQCKFCGDCATGCNHQAKKSLDTNLLYHSISESPNTKIYTGATVLKIEIQQAEEDSPDESWKVFAVYTDKLMRSRQTEPVELKTKKVILAAGSLGSSEILLRSRKLNNYTLSARLGKSFSTNGDTISAGYGQHDEVNCCASAEIKPSKRKIGPTITGIIDAHSQSNSKDNLLTIEEMAVPAALNRLFTEIVTIANSFNSLAIKDSTKHSNGPVIEDLFGLDPDKIQNTSLYAVMGDDGANGAITLNENDEYNSNINHRLMNCWDSSTVIRWPGISDNMLFEQQVKTLRKLANNSNIGGKILVNPLWNLVPDSMSSYLYDKKGMIFTVHPLGGCAMGNDIEVGVVNHIGQVFKQVEHEDFENEKMATKDKDQVFENLIVLDGSIIPTALSTNPALTIASLSLRAIELLKDTWKYSKPKKVLSQNIDLNSIVTPNKYIEDSDKEQQITPTEITVKERMCGKVSLNFNGKKNEYYIRLTSQFLPKKVNQLILNKDQDRVLKIDNGLNEKGKPISKIEIFEHQAWLNSIEAPNQEESQKCLNSGLLFEAPIRGELIVFSRHDSSKIYRSLKSFCAWLLNRGLRDIWQSIPIFKKDYEKSYLKHKDSKTNNAPNDNALKDNNWYSKINIAISYLKTLMNLTTRAGEIRLFEYKLNIDHKSKFFSIKEKDENLNKDIIEYFKTTSDNPTNSYNIEGVKTITYSVSSNPWRQMSQIKLTNFLYKRNLVKNNPPILNLDLGYLAKSRIPLVEISKQQDQVSSLIDLVSIGTYILRLLSHIHLFSFRMPDIPIPHEPRLLPARVKNMPKPIIEEITLDTIQDNKVKSLPKGSPVKIRLTRYPVFENDKEPILFIHGYSATGTTFIKPIEKSTSVARFFHDEDNRDVWILDLRTSAGMPTACYPWSIETVALTDIPVAIDYIYKECGRKKVNVFGHCMGSQMVSMAILGAGQNIEIPEHSDTVLTHSFIRRVGAKLPDRINKLILSQAGPYMEFSPANKFRAYLAGYIKDMFPVEAYQLRVSDDPSLAEQLLDRVLSTLPYSETEFRIENPRIPCKRTPYTGIRHRLDALYGQLFDLSNMDEFTLSNLEDYFGTLNLNTLAQTILFSREGIITTRDGRNIFLSYDQLANNWIFPTLCVHAKENKVFEFQTLHQAKNKIRHKNYKINTLELANYGHQDSWLGTDTPNKKCIVFAREHGQVATSYDQITKDRSQTDPNHHRVEKNREQTNTKEHTKVYTKLELYKSMKTFLQSEVNTTTPTTNDGV